MKVVIEHLEPWLSRWLWIEYSHACRLARGKLMFTNVKREDHRLALSTIAPAFEESALELYSPDEVVILDPQAEEKLEPWEIGAETVIVVGGILGDHPPRGRTRKLLTSKAPRAKARSLGEGQFAIDGAVYMALKVAEGTRLEEIPVKKGLTVRDGPLTIHLPYFYPLRNRKPVVSRQLIDYLKRGIVEDEERLLRGEPPYEVVREVLEGSGRRPLGSTSSARA